jgi:hypothetical protein
MGTAADASAVCGLNQFQEKNLHTRFIACNCSFSDE